MDYEEVAPLLKAIEEAQQTDGMLTVDDLAEKVGASVGVVRQRIGEIERYGLAFATTEDMLPPWILHAGDQYMAREGKVEPAALAFLPSNIDDLHTRQALLTAGTVMVAEFRYDLLNGQVVEHAKVTVPEAFQPSVTEEFALDLFAAAVALMARLSHGQPAGCLAEEVMAVVLMTQAAEMLRLKADEGKLDKDELDHAEDELRGLFELFQDDDVLRLWEMSEPADAAVAGHDPIVQQLGVVDLRVSAWFLPFGGVAPTGYLHERPDET